MLVNEHFRRRPISRSRFRISALVLLLTSLTALMILTARSQPPVPAQEVPPTVSAADSEEEFVGPFSNWTNVKASGLNCAGDGITDDTGCLQKALDTLSKHHPIAYLPAGTYKITHTLHIAGISNVSVIGADPATTSIVWAGAPGGTMLLVGNSCTANFTAAISGTALTVSAMDAANPGKVTLPCPIQPGAAGETPARHLEITAFGTGLGGTGTYELSLPQEVSTEKMAASGGVAYSRFDRITFNGRNTAGIGIRQAYANNSTPCCFDTGNEYADDVFEDLTRIGFSCGDYGLGCAEVALIRDRFVRNLDAGVFLHNFNALDIWCWYCEFIDDGIGMGNYSPIPAIGNGAGNFHAYKSVFVRSKFADISIGNTGPMNFVGNYSFQSRRFLYAARTANPAQLTLIGNTVSNTFEPEAIRVEDFGQVLLLNNRIRTPSGSAPVVSVNRSGGPGDLLSAGNIFTIGNGRCGISAPAWSGSDCHEIDDAVVPLATFDTSASKKEPTLPRSPQNRHRNIYEVTPETPTAAIQRYIDLAARYDGVVHIQAGTTDLTNTLLIPANSHLQIIGDGGYSELRWSGPPFLPMIKLSGPSKAVLRDFRLTGDGRGGGNGGTVTGVLVTDTDQTGGRIFMDQPLLEGSRTNFSNEAAGDTLVEMHDFQHSEAGAPGSNSVVISGSGTTNIVAGAASGNYNSYLISGSANVLIFGVWYDTSGFKDAHQAASVTGNGNVTYCCGATNMKGATSRPTLEFTNFSGRATITTMAVNYTDTGPLALGFSGIGSGGQWLAVGMLGPACTPPGYNFYSDATSPPDAWNFLNGQSRWDGITIGSVCNHSPIGEGSLKIEEACSTVACPDPALVRQNLHQLLLLDPAAPAVLLPGQTDVRMYRLYVQRCLIGIRVQP